jgi:hypothetical protein
MPLLSKGGHRKVLEASGFSGSQKHWPFCPVKIQKLKNDGPKKASRSWTSKLPTIFVDNFPSKFSTSRKGCITCTQKAGRFQHRKKYSINYELFPSHFAHYFRKNRGFFSFSFLPVNN